MKKTITAICCVLAFVLSVTIAQAIPLYVGSPEYVGNIVPDIPSNEASELAYINYLIDLPAGQGPIGGVGGQIYNRLDSSLSPGDLPDAVSFLSKDEEVIATDGVVPFSVDQTVYVMTKHDAWDAGGFVWFVEAGNHTVPVEINGFEISHLSLYSTSVPEPGTCFLILGLILVCLPAIKRESV